LALVADREKDIQFSSRTRAVTDRLCERHELLQHLRTLVGRLAAYGGVLWPCRSDQARQQGADSMRGNGLPDGSVLAAKDAQRQRPNVFNARQIAVVRKDMGMGTVLAHKGLGVGQLHRPQSGMPDVGSRQVCGRTLGFEMPHQCALRGRGRLANQCPIQAR
jgi:hypothetical protein